MIENYIYVECLSAPEVDRREALRYAGVRESDRITEDLLTKCIAEAEGKLIYKVCYRAFDLHLNGEKADLGFASVKSSALAKRLDGCEKIIVFCATVGSEFDRLIAKYNILSPSAAVMMQALGSERVEALCDAFCANIGEDTGNTGYSCTTRFSPGYGDLPLDLQRDIFAALDCTKKIGVSLNNNLFMTPTKSVTAIIGLKNVK